MITPELIDFIKRDLSLSISKDDISVKLKTQGWTQADVDEAFNIINSSMINGSAIVSNNPISSNTNTIISPMHPEIPIQNISSINATNNYVPVSNKRKIIKISIIIVLFVFVLLIFFVAYASGYFTSQDKIFSNFLTASNENTSVLYDFNIKIDSSNMNMSSTDLSQVGDFKMINFNSKGAVDFSDKENIKFSNNMFSKIGEIELGADVRMINKSLYLSFTKAPELGFFSLKTIENKWVVIKQNESSNLVNNPLLGSMPLNMYPSNNFTEERSEKIMELLKNAKIVKITKKHFPQMIDGNLAYHFDFELDRQGIISFITELRSYIITIDASSSGGIPEINDEDLNKIISYIDNFKGEIWVGVFNKLPYKISTNFNVIDPDDLNKGFSFVSADISYSEWNKPVSVEVPNGAVSIEEMLKSGFGGFSNSISEESSFLYQELTPKQKESIDDITTSDINNPFYLEAAKTKNGDSTIKSILGGMIANAELFYDNNKNSYKGYCRDKGEFGAYQSAIKLPNGTVYKCNDLTNVWVAWAQLSNKEYFCVDNIGTTNSFNKLPSGTSCPR